MIQDLEEIEYRKGMLEKGMKPDSLPVKVWRGAKMTAEVRKGVNEEDLLNLGGVYGDKNASISAYPFITRMEAEIARFEKEEEITEGAIDLEKLVANLTRVR